MPNINAKSLITCSFICVVSFSVGYFCRYKSENGNVKGVSQYTDQSVIENQVTDDDQIKKTSWSTYTNKEAGYTFKYPNEMVIKKIDEDEDLVLENSDKEVLHFLRQSNPKGLNPWVWMQNNFDTRFIQKFKNENISGRPASTNMDDMIYFILLPNKQILTISYNACQQSDCKAGGSQLEIFKQILETLNFELN